MAIAPTTRTLDVWRTTAAEEAAASRLREHVLARELPRTATAVGLSVHAQRWMSGSAVRSPPRAVARVDR